MEGERGSIPPFAGGILGLFAGGVDKAQGVCYVCI